MFATIEFIRLLDGSDWFCDSTFACSPVLFGQVYSVHAIVEGKSLPIVYALLTNKDKPLYIRSSENWSRVLRNRSQATSSRLSYKRAVTSSQRLQSTGATFISDKACGATFNQAVWQLSMSRKMYAIC